MLKPTMPPVHCRFFESEVLPASLQESIINDELIFSWVLPTFDNVFTGRQYHRTRIVETALSSSSSNASLAPSDLMLSLKFLSSVRYADVKNGIISGLLTTLQNGGQIMNGAWVVVVDIIEQVPLSMPTATDEASDDSTAEDLQSQDDGGQQSNQIWSKQALTHAFNCIQLIVS
jgi:hypothetical protein